MFRHKTDPASEEKNTGADISADAASSEPKSDSQSSNSAEAKPGKEETLKDLLEKNLKWSQIIYEQNRKLNHKLIWSAIASWLRLLIILVPLVLAILYLPRIIRDARYQYENMSGNKNAGLAPSFDNFLKIFNLDPAKQEQLKALLK